MSTLTRRTPLVRRPKAKGNKFEQWLVNELRDHGFPQARRNLASGGFGGSDVVNTPGYAFEAKCQQRLNIWAALDQAQAAASPTETPVVVLKRNFSREYACLPWDDFIALVEAASL